MPLLLKPGEKSLYTDNEANFACLRVGIIGGEVRVEVWLTSDGWWKSSINSHDSGSYSTRDEAIQEAINRLEDMASALRGINHPDFTDHGENT